MQERALMEARRYVPITNAIQEGTTSFLLLLLLPITKPTHQGQVLGVPQLIRSQAGGKEPQIDFRLKKTKRKKSHDKDMGPT